MNKFKILITKILRKTGLIYDEISVRLFMSDEVVKSCENTVRYGPFKGLKFTEKAWWGQVDRGAQCLGLYEKEILTWLEENGPFDTFIDVGCADGYYLCGMLKSGLAKKAFGFDISEKAKQASRLLARKNELTEIELGGLCSPEVLRKIIVGKELNKKGILLLMDIEGFEFEFFGDSYSYFLGVTLIIECHLKSLDEIEQFEKLKTQFGKTHSVSIIHNSGRSPYDYTELQAYHDNYKWIFCSEGRPFPTPWLIATPL